MGCMSKCQLPDLRLLRAFEVAARHLSIKLAGDELHVSRAAVSRSIRKLERELGCRLFDRYHRKIALTDAGETLLIDVAGGLSQVQSGIARLKTNRSSERLIISVDPDFAGLWLVPRLTISLHFRPTPRLRFLRRKRRALSMTRESIAQFTMRRPAFISRTPSPCLDPACFPFALRAADRRHYVLRRIFVTTCCCMIDLSLSGRNFFRAIRRLSTSI